MSGQKPHCAVLANVNVGDIEVVSKQIEKTDVMLITNNKQIQIALGKLGFNAKHFGDYFEDGSAELFAVQEEAVRKVTLAKKLMKDIRFLDVPIIEGLKLMILEDLMFIEKIRSILRNVQSYVFVFDDFNYRYFAINQLSSSMGYSLAVDAPQKVVDGRLREVGYDQLLSDDYKSILESKENPANTEPDKVEEFARDIQVNPSENGMYGFFLVENEEEYYLKPVYPVIDKFIEKKENLVLFSFTTRTADQVMARGYKVHNLSKYTDDMELVVLAKERQFVYDVFTRMATTRWGDIILDSYFKLLFNDYIVRSFARMLAVILVVDEICKKLHFRSLVVATDGDPDNDIVCSIANKHHIPTYSVVPFVKQFSPMFRVLYSASKLFVSGPRLEQELKKVGIDTSRIIIIGSPRYDYLGKNLSGHKGHDKPVDSQMTVLVATSRIYENDEVWMSELVRSCAQRNLKVVIKIHPLYKFKEDLKQIADEKISYINQQCQGLDYMVLFEGEIADLLKKANVLVTDYSSVALEASLRNLPVIIYSRSEETKEDHFLSFEKEGIALLAHNKQQLFQGVETVLKDNAIALQLGEKRKIFNKDLNYLNDGKASERIYKILTGN